MPSSGERTLEHRVHLVDQAIKRKELLRQRRLAALNDVPRNEHGGNLDDQLQFWRPRPVKWGMHKTFAEAVIGLEERRQQKERNDREAGRSNFKIVSNTELDIARLQLSEFNREAGEFMHRREERGEKRDHDRIAENTYHPRDLLHTSTGSVAPELDMVQGAAVRCTAFSEDGMLLATGDQSGKIHLWARKITPGPGRPWRGWQQLSGHKGAVTALAFVPAGDLTEGPNLLSAAGDCTVKRWAMDLWDRKWRWEENVPVESSSWVMDMCYIGVEENKRFGVDGALLIMARGDRNLSCLTGAPATIIVSPIAAATSGSELTDTPAALQDGKQGEFGAPAAVLAGAKPGRPRRQRRPSTFMDPTISSNLKTRRTSSGSSEEADTWTRRRSSGASSTASNSNLKSWTRRRSSASASSEEAREGEGNGATSTGGKQSTDAGPGESGGKNEGEESKDGEESKEAEEKRKEAEEEKRKEEEVKKERRENRGMSSRAKRRRRRRRRVAWNREVRMEGHTDAVVSCTRGSAPIQGHQFVVSVGVDWTVKLWRIETTTIPDKWVCECTIMDATSSSRTSGSAELYPLDPTVLASAYRDRVLFFQLKLGNAPDLVVGHQQLATLHGHVDDVLCVAFRSDGKLLASSDALGQVKLWTKHDDKGHADGWACVATMHAGQRQACGLRFGSGEARGSIVVCSEKGRVRMWDTTSLVPLDPLPHSEPSGAGPVSDPAEKVPETEAEAKLASGVVLAAPEFNLKSAVGPPHQPVLSLALMAAEGKVAAAGYGGGFGVWAVDKGAMQRKLPWRADVTCLTVIQTVEDAEDEHVTHHVVCGAADGAVKACAVEEDGTRRDRMVHGAGGGAVGMLRASEGGGERVLCVWESGRVVLWESKAWAPLFVYSHTAQISAAALLFQPGASYVAIAGTGKKESGTVVRFNAQQGTQAGRPVRVHSTAVACLCLHPLGQLIASVGKGSSAIRITSLEREATEAELKGHEGHVTALEMVSGGVGGARSASRSASRSGARPGKEGAKEGQVDPREALLLVSGGVDGTVRVWTWTGEARAVLSGHREWVRCVAGAVFDGHVQVASGSEDGAVRVWDVEAQACRQTLVQDSAFVQQIWPRLARIRVEVGFGDDPVDAKHTELHAHPTHDDDDDDEEEEGGGAEEEGMGERPPSSASPLRAARSPLGSDKERLRRREKAAAAKGKERRDEADIARMHAYIDALRLALDLHNVATGPPEEELAIGAARRARAHQEREAAEAVRRRNLTDREHRLRERRKRTRMEPEPTSVEESAAQRRRAVVWMCRKMLAAAEASEAKSTGEGVSALLRHRHSFDPTIRSAAALSLCAIGARARAPSPAPDADSAEDEELAAAKAEVEELEEEVLGLAEEVAGMDQALASWKTEFMLEMRKAAKDKRRGKDLRLDLERRDKTVTRKHAAERTSLVAEQLRLMAALRSAPLRRLSDAQARWVVHDLLAALSVDFSPLVREAGCCALALLAARGDRRVAEEVSALVGDPSARVREAAVLCLGETAEASRAATAKLVELLRAGHSPEVKMSALEGLAVVLRRGGGGAGAGGGVLGKGEQRAVMAAARLLKDEDARVRDRALLVGSYLALGTKAGLPHFASHATAVFDKLPPFAASPFVPYPAPDLQETHRVRPLDAKRRGQFPHLEPLAPCIPPTRSFHTGKQLDWPSESERLYSSSPINPSVQLPGVVSSSSRGQLPPDASNPRPPLLCERPP